MKFAMSVRVSLVHQQIVLQDLPGEWSQHRHGETDPTVLPDAVGIFIQVPLQVGHGPVGQLAGSRPFDDVGKVVGLKDREREIDALFFADHDGLQLRFAAGCGVADGKRETFDADSVEVVYVELFHGRFWGVDLFAIKAVRGQGRTRGRFGSAHG
jgi:hypothetical protein